MIDDVELEGTAVPVERLTLSAGMGYLDARYTRVSTGVVSFRTAL